MKKFIHLLILTLCFGTAAMAQRYLGTATSNYSGLASLYLNPASIADNTDRIVIDLFNFNVAVDNNLGKINANPGISRFINGGENNINDVFSFSDKAKFSLIAPYFEVRGPGIMFKIAHNQSVAFTTRIRGVNQLNNFDQSLYRTITDSTYARSGNLDLVAQNFNWTAQLWTEMAGTYGAVVLDRGRNEIIVGATVRYLAGVGFLGMKGKNLDLHYSSGADSFYAKNTDLEYASNILSATSALTNGISGSSLFNNFLAGKGGSGAGADFGVIYDYLEPGANDNRYDMDGKTGLSDQSKPRYKLRLSASVTDLGFITYAAQNNYAVNVTGNGYITGKGFSDNVKDFNDFTTYTAKQGFHADTQRGTNRVYMPTSLMLSADYHAWKSVYVNASYFNNLVSTTSNNFGSSFYNQLTITPRWDMRRYSIGLPITYSWLSETMKVGLGLRYSGFYIGSDDMLAAFSHAQYGLNIYAGGFIPFGNKKPKDKDGDHVSDRKDWCPDDYGDWANHGCPLDMLKDGKKQTPTADTTDNCPEASGLAASDTEDKNKDTDGDGIPDYEDACPTVAGVAENHGCPETNKTKKVVTDLKKSTLQWKAGRTPLSKSDYEVLARFAKLMKEYPARQLVIEGFTDNKGKESHNTTLSLNWASTVRNYFTGKGIAESRLRIAGKGSAQPVADNNTAEGRAQNRRVEIRMEK